jgi:hypothetical protein
MSFTCICACQSRSAACKARVHQQQEAKGKDQGPVIIVEAFNDLRQQGARSRKVMKIDKRATPPIPPLGLLNV